MRILPAETTPLCVQPSILIWAGVAMYEWDTQAHSPIKEKDVFSLPYTIQRRWTSLLDSRRFFIWSFAGSSLIIFRIKYVGIRVWSCKNTYFWSCACGWHWTPGWSCWVQSTIMITAAILLFPFQPLLSAKPEGDLNSPLTPAALCNPCAVVIYSIFTLITLLIFHMAVPKSGRTFSSSADVVFCSIAAASLLICSVCFLHKKTLLIQPFSVSFMLQCSVSLSTLAGTWCERVCDLVFKIFTRTCVSSPPCISQWLMDNRQPLWSLIFPRVK